MSNNNRQNKVPSFDIKGTSLQVDLNCADREEHILQIIQQEHNVFPDIEEFKINKTGLDAPQGAIPPEGEVPEGEVPLQNYKLRCIISVQLKVHLLLPLLPLVFLQHLELLHSLLLLLFLS